MCSRVAYLSEAASSLLTKGSKQLKGTAVAVLSTLTRSTCRLEIGLICRPQRTHQRQMGCCRVSPAARSTI